MIAHAGLTELHVVETMHERKAMMAERAIAFMHYLAVRDIRRILEIATWGQLNQHQKTHDLYT